MRLRALMLTALVGLALPAAAAAHGRSHAYSGFVSTVSSIQPNVLGLQAKVLGGDRRLFVRNWSGRTVVILDRLGEPYLRFGPMSGVWKNVAGPNRPPRWRKVDDGTSYVWHEHRIHVAGKPAIVVEEPDEPHHILDWKIPGRAGGKAFAIEGFLGYTPPEGSGGDGHANWLLVLAAVAGGLSVLVGAAAMRSRPRPRARVARGRGRTT